MIRGEWPVVERLGRWGKLDWAPVTAYNWPHFRRIVAIIVIERPFPGRVLERQGGGADLRSKALSSEAPRYDTQDALGLSVA